MVLEWVLQKATADVLNINSIGEVNMKQIIGFISLLLFTSSVFAFNDFKCAVKAVYKLNMNGVLEQGAGFVTPDVGSEFTVNRQSGQITGKKIGNTMSGVMPTVYDFNRKETSYTAITIYKIHYTIDLLQIKEYVKKPEKPFIYKGAFGEVVTGLCTVQ